MSRSPRPDLPKDHPPIQAHSSDLQRTRWRDIALWGGAGAVMLVAHAAGAYAIRHLQPSVQPDGSPPPAIMMELAPEPIAPAVEEAALVPEAQPEDVTEEAVETEQAEVIEPVEEIQPETAPEEIVREEPAEEVEKPEEPVPDVVEAPKPEVVVPKQKPKVVEKPKPKPKPKQEKPKVVEKAEPKKLQKPKPTKQAAAPQVDAKNGPKVAASRNSDTAGSPGVNSNRWQAKVQAHLNRQKRYLERRMPGVAGTVRLTFSIDASGNVLSARGSSGNPALDQLAAEMVQRASPVPAPPPAIAKTRMSLTIPIRFK
ncbi:energy transducer TonB [Phyllobacterium salinisoli]|uniref:Energy transducer TonB n=1 Tax=Phyllobacterium salinisoli TaxID=1899321 RepID=A0A368K534_9HYPH|nr:TonB family protein [Phyllobacterium salinisoli]RCS23755.1 energy transducer TonB [Phyllobacterium salinisoli]